ncbi:MAG TPA: hypothetical protein VLH10_23680 [Yinghuangia sp.]|nr:hypothetical protein [Yinghuangia sp.]
MTVKITGGDAERVISTRDFLDQPAQGRDVALMGESVEDRSACHGGLHISANPGGGLRAQNGVNITLPGFTKVHLTKTRLSKPSGCATLSA